MASDALWIVSFKCVVIVKGYQKCRFDVKDGEGFKVLKETGDRPCVTNCKRARTPSTCSVTFNVFCHLQHVLFCSLKCRGQFMNGVSVLRVNCKKAQEKPVLMGLLWACFVYM